MKLPAEYKIEFLTAMMLLTSISAWSQNRITLDRKGEAFSGKSVPGMNDRMIGTQLQMGDMPVNYGRYSDERMKELTKEMQERSWESEETAWDLARSLDTRDAYEKYIKLYPGGAHREKADGRIVDFKVDDIFNGSHNHLPGMLRTVSDDKSTRSTILIENMTKYVLTVIYSGPDSKEIQISPGRKDSITIPNGNYRIAASVPDENVRPFAGFEDLAGGHYEIGFCIVQLKE